MALYADNYLSEGQANGNYLVPWSDGLAAHLSDYYIVDVRLLTAYNTSHIIGAVSIPYATVAKPYNLDKLPIDKPILVYCGSGQLSIQVTSILGMMGYDVRALTTKFSDVPAAYKEAS